MFGPGVRIFSVTHETGVEARRECIALAKQVNIGSDCFIGGGTTILPGVTIGKGCTVGAASVVTRDIPPFSVAAGSPARVVKRLREVLDVVGGDQNSLAKYGLGAQ